MFDTYDLPISEITMPWLVKDTLRDHRYGELVSISRHAYGTPDGECDTESWDMTFVMREMEHVFHATYIFKEGMPILTKVVYWDKWIDHGIKYVTTFKRDGTYHFEVGEVVVDMDKIWRMVDKTLGKKTIELEVA